MDTTDIKLFTATELSQWLSTGQSELLARHKVISPARALAFVNNPYILPDDPVACALLLTPEGGDTSVVAFTAAFPDMVGNERMWWFSTLWCHPSHRGKGYPLALVGSLAEVYGPEHCLDTLGAAETVEIFRFLGHQVSYLHEHRFGSKVQRQGLRGNLLFFREQLKSTLRKHSGTALNTIRHTPYTLQYTNHLDDTTYQFIQQHAAADLFPRTRQMYDWIMQYPLKRRAPLPDRTASQGLFGDSDPLYWISGVKVLFQGETVGFYIIRNAESDLSIKYLYYDEAHRQQVFTSIAEHIIQLGNSCFSTRHPELADFIQHSRLYSRHRIADISLSCPPSFTLPPNAISQGGDGDCFV